MVIRGVAVGERALFMVWVLLLLGFYLIAGYLASTDLYQDRIESAERHHERVNPALAERGKTAPDFERLTREQGHAQKVKVGIYVDRIQAISTKETLWTVDFYLWFEWDGDDIKPGESFHVVDGEILSKKKIRSRDDGDSHYELYHVAVRITKVFNIARYPHDDHLLTIRVEESNQLWEELQYVPDVDNSTYSSRVTVPGYQIYRSDLINKPHAYKSSRGDPLSPNSHKAAYSQLTYGLWIKRPGWGLYFKMFQGLFAAVAIAFLAYLLAPAGSDRIGLGVGAFFAAVANSYINLTELPGVGMVTLTDMVNGIGMVTIMLTLFGTIISSHLAERKGEVKTARIFDRVSLAVFVVGFVAVNVAIAISAAV